MKNSDIALIAVIAIISVTVSYFAFSSLIGPAEFGSVKVPTIESISADIVEPDKNIFNLDAINPSVEVNIQVDEAKK